MGGWETFSNAILKEAETKIETILNDPIQKQNLYEAMGDHLQGAEQSNRSLDSHEEYFSHIFKGHIDIFKSFETLEDISFYIGHFPFRNTQITQPNYLKFHIEAHFNEIYTLREYLEKYINRLKKQFKKDPRLPDFQEQCSDLIKSIHNRFSEFTTIRNKHIHKSRFKDESLDQLQTFDLLAKNSKDEKFSKLMSACLEDAFKKTQKMWQEKTTSNLESIRPILGEVFDFLFPIVFDPKTENLRVPNGIRTSRRS